MIEQAPRWRFRRTAPGEIIENPVQGEFFTSSVAELPERLVREAIQNSMDAALPHGDKRVRIRFSFGRHPLSRDHSRAYLTGIYKHLEACAPIGTLDLLNQPLTWLAIEDFDTKGLTGQVESIDTNGQGNNFWGFFRQIGISTKGENEGGSWGLGKWVFPDASQLNSFLAITRREGESRLLMMGLAVLKTHMLGTDKYPAYGHFAAHSDLDDSIWLQLPVDSSQQPGFVQQAISDFELERRNSSGLSVIVPWPKSDLTPNSITRAIITQYFLPIILGDLEIIIESADGGTRSITQDTIHNELRRLPDSEMGDGEHSKGSVGSLLRLAEWAVDVPSDRQIVIPLSGLGSAEQRAFEDFDFDQLREQFEHGERIAVRQRIPTTRKVWSGRQRPTESDFSIYLERDESLENGHDYFVRGHLQIPAMDHISRIRARALLMVDGKAEIAHLLRDSEGPAHTKWDPHAERLKQGWSGGYARVQAVRQAPLRLLRRLTERPVDRQMDALADLFPANVPAATGKPVVNPGNGGGSGPAPLPPPQAPSPVRLEPASGGFSLLPNNQFPVSLQSTAWSVRFAYELARGSKNRAFAQFDSGVKDGCPDFSLADELKHESSGCRLEIAALNRLTVSIDSDDFRLTVTGFDLNRDVLVEVNQIQSDESESE